jgi:hypothetical protein
MARDAFHPGEQLAEELNALDMSATELARQLKVPTNRVTEILNGQRAIRACGSAISSVPARNPAQLAEPLRPAPGRAEGGKEYQDFAHPQAPARQAGAPAGSGLMAVRKTQEYGIGKERGRRWAWGIAWGKTRIKLRASSRSGNGRTRRVIAHDCARWCTLVTRRVRLSISGSKVRVLDGPPLKRALPSHFGSARWFMQTRPPAHCRVVGRSNPAG